VETYVRDVEELERQQVLTQIVTVLEDDVEAIATQVAAKQRPGK
jgi:hypothetical protein